MTLSANDISALSRLLDQALALHPSAIEPWLQALPAEHATLLPHLRRMLVDRPGHTDGLISTLPQIGGAEPPDPHEPQPGERVGAYRLLRTVGRGGMGSVWLAARDDGIFERQVAIKLPRMGKSARLAERMALERQIGALLEHPHIARLYDAGVDIGIDAVTDASPDASPDARPGPTLHRPARPYLVMEHVVGVDLITYAQRHQLDMPARLRVMLQVCQAVAHAHRQLVVHRDIKPSNLLVNESGQVKLLDFGIAKRLDADAAVPGAGTGASDSSAQTHTPRYAAPEQRHAATATTLMDIYALGVVLRELLTGELPSPAGTSALLSTSSLSSASLSPDLRAVLDRALQVDPAQRYTSVERLADDLQRVLDHRPVRAAAVGRLHRLRLFITRHRWGLSAGALLCAVLLVAGVLMWRQQLREQHQAQRATQAREFLFEVLEDLEPTEPTARTAALAAPHTTTASALSLLQSALARARAGFAEQPVLRGNVLVELGHLLHRLDQPEQALAVLRDAHNLLAATASADDPTLHFAEVFMARVLAENDAAAERAKAMPLAQTALAGCAADTLRCAKVRAYAHELLRNAANAKGDSAQALQQARLALHATQRGFGAQHVETALAWRSLAVILRNQGALREADAAITQASAIVQTATLRAADRADLRLKQALLHADMGRYAQAQSGFQALLQEPAAPALRAQQQRLLALVLFGQGWLAPAQDAADAALAAASQAQHAFESVLAQQVQASIASAQGQHGVAQAAITATLDGLRQLGLPEASVPVQRARRVAVEVALRAGRLDDARTTAATLLPLAGVDAAVTLDLQGTLARVTGNAPSAAMWHTQAAPLLAAELPPEHPLRLKNALNLALAHGLSAPGADSQALRAAAAAYQQAWPAGSAWRLLPDSRSVGPVDHAAWRRLVL